MVTENQENSSSQYILMIMMMIGHLMLKFDNFHTILWFQEFVFDTNNSWFQVTIHIEQE